MYVPIPLYQEKCWFSIEIKFTKNQTTNSRSLTIMPTFCSFSLMVISEFVSFPWNCFPCYTSTQTKRQLFFLVHLNSYRMFLKLYYTFHKLWIITLEMNHFLEEIQRPRHLFVEFICLLWLTLKSQKVKFTEIGISADGKILK